MFYRSTLYLPGPVMDRAHRTNVRALAAAISLFASAYAQTVNTPGQPSTNQAPLGQFKIVGDSIVSAQQVRASPPTPHCRAVGSVRFDAGGL